MKTIIKNMTLEEKCLFLSGKNTWQTRDFSRHGIPSLWLADGPHGLRKQLGSADHLGLAASQPATCFPTAAAIANSWDTALGEELGRALGEEAAAQGVHVLLGPGLNIKRSPLCGRNFEYFSEDPYLAGKLAAAYIRGIQHTGGAACPKHFAVNSQEERRMASNSVVDERTLREIYLTGFEIAVTEGKPGFLMTSYNAVNGTYTNENPHLLRDILREEWGFDGAVVTDWGGSNDHPAGVKHGSALAMPGLGLAGARELLEAVKAGDLTEADIDARAEELLTQVLALNDKLAEGEFDKEAHHALAKRAAGESIVLLKNEGNLLPLKSSTKVAILGDFAKNPRYQGAGSSIVEPTALENFLDQPALAELNVLGYAPGFLRREGKDEALKSEAVELAAKAEVALLFLGLDEQSESEGLDRAHMKLHQNQWALVDAVAAVNPNIVLILSGGSAVELPGAAKAKAILCGCLGGQAGAGAMAEVITGKVNPSGKLAETWPEKLEDTPTFGNYPAQGWNALYKEGLYVGYRYYDTVGAGVAYPFGFGLSYTSFAYSGLEILEDRVRFCLTNTGAVAGSEVSQLYISKEAGEVFRPSHELKGFAKTFLNPGESKILEIPLDDKAFRYFNVKTNRWEIEGGSYTLSIGASSRDLKLRGTVTQPGTGAPNPYAGLDLPSYAAGQVGQVSEEEFSRLLGTPIPEEPRRIHRNSPFRDLNRGYSPLGWLIRAGIGWAIRRGKKEGVPNLDLYFVYNMPLRGLVKMLGGKVSVPMVDGLVAEFRGFWILGLLKFLAEGVRNAVQNRSLKQKMEEIPDEKAKIH